MKPFPKRYLGGDVYAECLGHSLVLTVEHRMAVGGRVVIDAEYMPDLIRALVDAGVYANFRP